MSRYCHVTQGQIVGIDYVIQDRPTSPDHRGMRQTNNALPSHRPNRIETLLVILLFFSDSRRYSDSTRGLTVTCSDRLVLVAPFLLLRVTACCPRAARFFEQKSVTTPL